MLKRTRRAPKACLWCHHRKVRCDASIRGCPCTRCRQDGRPDCVLRGELPRNFSGFAVTNDGGVDHPALNRTSPTIPIGHVTYSSYSFLELNAKRNLDQDDLAYLAAKGCLSVPDKTLIEDFLRAYFLHIHPYVPILDEAGIWDMYRLQDDDDVPVRISLFLFQAVLFASSPYVSKEVIRKCGFEDKRGARNALYKKAKVLFDLRADDRSLVQAQGAVLLSFHTSADEPQAGSLWLTRAIQAAAVVGCKPGPSAEVGASVRKRLSWSIILRDRSLCLGLRRRPQVTSVDFAMEVEPLEEDDFAEEIHRSQVYGPNVKRLLFKALQEQCRLAVSLTKMVSFVFASHGLSAPRLSLHEFRESLAKIKTTKELMKQWETCSKMSAWMSDALPEPVNLFVNFTFMYYQTARIDIAHYESLLIENHAFFMGHDYITQRVDTGATLHDAMSNLASIMEYFSREGRAQSLPLSVLAYVAMPLVLTAIDLKLSSSSAELHFRRRRLDALGEIVRHSRQVYDVTDFVSTGTNHILQLAYTTAQHLFLRWDCNSSPPSSTSSSADSGNGGDNAVQGKTHPHVAPRAKDWYDAFLQCPRAYLLISTTVDYSLAVGRLPEDSCLPELVRCIPPIGVGIQLPWTTDRRQPGSTTTVTPASADTECRNTCQDQVVHAVSGMEDPANKDHVDLDYFPMDIISISSSNPARDDMPLGNPSSPDFQDAPQDNAMSDFGVHLGLDMSDWQFGSGDDLLDPLITSMIPNYHGGDSPSIGGEMAITSS